MKGRVEAWKVELCREASLLPVRAFGNVRCLVRRVMRGFCILEGFGDGGEVVRVCVMHWMDGAMAIWSIEGRRETGRRSGAVRILKRGEGGCGVSLYILENVERLDYW